MRASLIGAGLVGAVALAPAMAETEWSTVGAGCVPTGQTIKDDVHFQSAGRTSFAAGKVGEIILTCPITNEFNTASRIYMSYRDSDGPGTGASVEAGLRRLHIASGHVESIPLRPSALSSNLHDPTSWATISRLVSISTFNFSAYYYYVQINMRRTSILHTASFGGVLLTD